MKKLNNDIWHSAAVQSNESEVHKDVKTKFAWCLTGSGHYLKESLQLLDKMPETDIFLSKAAEEDNPASDGIFDETAKLIPFRFKPL